MTAGLGRLRPIAAEAIGTAVLVLVGPGAVMVAASTGAIGPQGVAFAFGLVVFVLVASLGTVSGAHVNPAVTIALWSVGKFPRRSVVGYIAAQCVGAIASAFFLRWVLGPIADVGATIPAIPLARTFAVESAFSGLLGLVILLVSDPRVESRSLAPLAIGATVGVGALVAGPLTGGSFNPARSLGPAIASGQWTAHWVYWLAPIAAMLATSQLWRLTFARD